MVHMVICLPVLHLLVLKVPWMEVLNIVLVMVNISVWDLVWICDILGAMVTPIRPLRVSKVLDVLAFRHLLRYLLLVLPVVLEQQGAVVGISSRVSS